MNQPSRRRSMTFPWMLLAVATAYFAFVGYRLAFPTGSAADETRAQGFLARCREICARYGLLPSGDLAKDAEAYLDAARPNQLQGELQAILSDPEFQPEPSQSHPLLGQAAPEFSLRNTARQRRSLADLTNGRPAVVVFYYGYFCNHCVAQLFGLEQDLHYFRELGAEVIAISADSPQHTTEKFQEYGAFHFPVLSDPENAVAAQYGAFRPANADQTEQLDHATFVLDRNGRIVWANLGPEPFVDNQTLLRVIAVSRP